MEIKTSLLSKLLYWIVIIGMIVLAGILFTLPWLIDALYEMSAFMSNVNKVVVIAILYVTGLLAMLILWMTKNLAKNIINLDPFCESSIKSLKVISLSALAIFICYLGAAFFLYKTIVVIIITFGAFLVSIIAAILYRLVNLALQIKEENELTI